MQGTAKSDCQGPENEENGKLSWKCWNWSWSQWDWRWGIEDLESWADYVATEADETGNKERSNWPCRNWA